MKSVMRLVRGAMRKFLAVGASVLALSLMSTPAQAAGWGAIHITTVSAAIPVTCAGGSTGLTVYSATGNGVQHFNANSTGDWFTFTFEGQGTVLQTAGPLKGDAFQGHVVDWTGAAMNLQNGLFHTTFNFDGTDAAGQSLRMHAEAQFTVNTDGSPHLMRIDVSCS
jgi:hypothetical protein